MPPSANSPYRSRLFNFLNRQSLRLTAQMNLALRNVKVAAVWGVQILLYPLYLLTQASLSVARQISAQAKAGWPKLKPFAKSPTQPQEMLPEADAPIQRVLEEIGETWGRGDAGTRGRGDGEAGGDKGAGEAGEDKGDKEMGKKLQFPSPLGGIQGGFPDSQFPIQGIATLLSNRNLVLVGTQNQILDVLTPQQQQKLLAKIRWEVAGLLRQQRLELFSDVQLLPHPLISLAQPRLLPPVRLFWRLMAWIQTSPVAIAANLFGESQLACSVTILPEQAQLPPSKTQLNSQLPGANEQVIIFRLVPPEALAFLDRTAAELESHQLVPGTEVVIVLRERTYQLLQRLQSQLTTADSTASLEEPQTLKARIKALIYAAVEYFFGTNGSNLSQTRKQQELSTSSHPSGETKQLPGNGTNLLPPVEEALEEPQTLKARIKALIYAAVEYFFGKSGSHLPWTINPQQLPTSSNSPRDTASLPSSRQYPNPALPNGIESDPWLTLEDLFGTQDVPTSNPFTSGESATSTAQLPEAFGSKMPVQPGNSVVDSVKGYISRNPSPGRLSTPTAKPGIVEESDAETPEEVDTQQFLTDIGTQLIQGKPRDSASLQTRLPNENLSLLDPGSTDKVDKEIQADSLVGSNLGVRESQQQPTTNDNLEAAEDWIDTDASSTGYVKHPLEQLLEWLDSTMLRLEEFVIKIWHWLLRRSDR